MGGYYRAISTQRKIHVGAWNGYVPLPAQQRFHRSEAFGRLYAGAVRGGKTLAGCREAIGAACDHPGSLGLILRKEYRPLIDSTWRTFKEVAAATGLVDAKMLKLTGGTSPTSPPHAKFWNGSEILFRNANREENFLGLSLDWAYFDEGSELSDVIYEQIIGARLSGTPHPEGKIVSKNGVRVAGPLRYWITSNPGPSTYLRKNFVPPGVKGRRKPGLDVFAAKTHENTHLPDDYLENLKSQFSGARYEAYVNGDWGAFEGQAFPEFDPELHVIDDIGADELKGKLIVEGWDFGIAVETSVVWLAVDEGGDDRIIAFHDYGKAERSVPEHAAAVKEIRRLYGMREIMSLGDPAGRQRGPNGSWFAEYAQQGIYIAPCDMGKNPSIRDARLTKLLWQRVVTRDGVVPGIQFCKRTEGLQECIVTAQFKPDKGRAEFERPDARIKKNDHRLDSLGYALLAAPMPGGGADLPAGRDEILRDRDLQGVGVSGADALRIITSSD